MFGEYYKLWRSSLYSFLQTPVTSSLFGPNILLSTLFSWRDTKCLMKVTFWQPQVISRLVSVKHTMKSSASCYERAKLVRVLNFAPSGTCRAQQCPASHSRQAVWPDTLFSALLNTPRKTGSSQWALLFSDHCMPSPWFLTSRPKMLDNHYSGSTSVMC
jgi:hypothetical protein